MRWVALALFVAAGCAKAPAPRYRDSLATVVTHPTGKNGYEDFVRAAKLTNSPAFRRRLQLCATTTGPQANTLRRALVSDYGAVFKDIQDGLSKPVMYTIAKPTAMTLFPELSEFKAIAKLMIVKAEVEFAEGQQDAAASTLAQVLDFARVVRPTNGVVHYLVAISMESLGCSAVANHLGELSVRGAKSLEAAADRSLHESGLQSVIETEFTMLDRSLAAIADRMRGFTPQDRARSTEEEDLAAKSWGAGASSAQGGFSTVSRQKYREAADAAESLLSRPESEWSAAIGSSPTEYLDVNSAESMAIDKAGLSVPSAGGTVLVELKHRARMRILRLICRVIVYRGEHKKLPPALASVADGPTRFDPITGRDFRYEVFPDHFELYTGGTGVTGRIDLANRKVKVAIKAAQ